MIAGIFLALAIHEYDRMKMLNMTEWVEKNKMLAYKRPDGVYLLPLTALKY